MDDKSNIHDQDVKNNSLIQYKLKKGSNIYGIFLDTGDWEEFPELGIWAKQRIIKILSLKIDRY